MTPSPWIARFAPRVARDADVLDLACGAGRHARLFRARGHRVVAVDRDVSGVRDLVGDAGVEVIEIDLEDGAPFPLVGRSFAAIVVTNYLYRPLLPALVDAVAPNGWLLYETFSVDQARLGRPTNPDFLLRPGELADVVAGKLRVIAYEDVTDDGAGGVPVAVQRIAAVRPH